MKALLVAYRELKSYFSGWTAYLVMAGFLAVSGFIFYVILTGSRQAEMRWSYHNMAVTLLFVCPILTMRLLAEERRSGTLELLLTSPVTDFQVILGKFLAAVGLLAVLLAATMHFPLILVQYGSPDPGPLLTGYLGLLLVGASFMAVGVLASSLTESQVLAGFLSFGALLVLWIIGWGADQAASGIGEVLRQISILNHFDDMAKGVIDTKDLIFYLSFIAVFLFGAVRALESRKWR
ncbi:MAG: ABC transporter permease subunit [Armatimonadota bacterium]|nr:MAG: ABC transporter permease subunit [Armatimonadota bacterium]